VSAHSIIVIGGGLVGLSSAMLLARDGHHVTVLERDPAPPPEPSAAWASWQRRGVNQFRLPHAFLPRFRELLDAELPDLRAELVAEGALVTNRMAEMPGAITGGFRPEDARFEQVTGRRPMFEAVFARQAARESGVEIRRGVTVRGLKTATPHNGDIPHVGGVVTDEGEHLAADLVVDAGGRRSALPDWLDAAGARRPDEEIADSGFVYYGRHFRSDDGAMPPMLGPPLQPYESVSWFTGVADNGHWSVALVGSAKDRALRALRDVEVWERVVRSYPLIAHWVDAEPTTGVDVIAKIEDRVRDLGGARGPVATGVVAIGDASACTNPAVGRGASIGLLQATRLRDTLRTGDPRDPGELIRAWNERTRSDVTPYVRDTLDFDRHRLAEMDAEIEGVPYETNDPVWNLGQQLRAGAASDPQLLRAAMTVMGLLGRGRDVLQDEEILAKARAVDSSGRLPGPDRDELLDIIGTRQREAACA
jgi:2-polyprenyl-6-methoxyphenol hydroxylase-like FAD-dependent oxidoreductase